MYVQLQKNIILILNTVYISSLNLWYYDEIESCEFTTFNEYMLESTNYELSLSTFSLQETALWCGLAQSITIIKWAD